MADTQISARPAKPARPSIFKSRKFSSGVVSVISTLLVAFGAVIIMIPVVWMFSTSLKTQSNFSSMPPELLPLEGDSISLDGRRYMLYDVNIDGQVRTLAMVKLDPEKSEFFDPANPRVSIYAPGSAASLHKVPVFHWENYVTAWNFKATPFGQYMKNTILYSVVAVLAELVINSFVAFGFARLRAPGRNALFLLVLATMMLPYPVTMIPNFVLFTKYIPDFLNGILGTSIKLADSWWPLIIPKFFGSAYLIFLIRQFYMTIPRDFDEAARIDGAGYFQTWWRIIIPMSQPVLAAVAVLSFMFHWNEYMGPLIYINSTDKLPLSVGLSGFQAMYGGTPWHLMMAASLIAVAPLVIIFFALNRYFIQGVVVNGIRG